MSRDIIKPDIAGLSESSWPGSDALRYFYASAEIAKLGGVSGKRREFDESS